MQASNLQMCTCGASHAGFVSLCSSFGFGAIDHTPSDAGTTIDARFVGTALGFWHRPAPPGWPPAPIQAPPWWAAMRKPDLDRCQSSLLCSPPDRRPAAAPWHRLALLVPRSPCLLLLALNFAQSPVTVAQDLEASCHEGTEASQRINAEPGADEAVRCLQCAGGGASLFV